jgi:hypothetical protein
MSLAAETKCRILLRIWDLDQFHVDLRRKTTIIHCTMKLIRISSFESEVLQNIIKSSMW